MKGCASTATGFDELRRGALPLVKSLSDFWK